MPLQTTTRIRLTRWAVALSYALGIFLRYKFILCWNQATAKENVVSDALYYSNEAMRVFSGSYVPRIGDTVYPPGTIYFLGWMHTLDPTMELLMWTQFALSCCSPLIFAGIAWRLFGDRCSMFVLAFISVYFPSWEYHGYLMSDGVFAFLLGLSFYGLIAALQAKSRRISLSLAAGAGLTLGLSCAFKTVSLVSAAMVLIGLLVINHKHRMKIVPLVFAAALGLSLILVPLSIRATALNEGRFLLIANDAPRNFLLGHHGRIGLVKYRDEKRGYQHVFGSPAAHQRGSREVLSVDFGVYEPGPQYALGWQWIRENPLEAFLQALEHVFDLFLYSAAWPGSEKPYLSWVIFFQEIFLVFVLFPAAYHLVRHRREILSLDPAFSGDLLVALSALSIYFVAFLYLGEPRYRIAYDGFMILLASRAICGSKFAGSVLQRDSSSGTLEAFHKI